MDHVSEEVKFSQYYWVQLFGYRSNTLDRWIRNGQDGQTIGIPIGPDASLVVAETILCAADLELKRRLSNVRGFRYIDDYEFGFQTHSNAEEALAIVQSVLKEYELELNYGKTYIDELPISLESRWVAELRSFQFRSTPKAQNTDLIHYCDLAFILANENPDDHVLKYAVRRLKPVKIDSSNWDFVQDFLFNCLTTETGTFLVVLEHLIERHREGYSIDLHTLEELINYQISVQCPIDHGSEVAWAVLAAIYWGINLNASSTKALSDMDDSIVALLTLDALQRGLVPNGLDTTLWESHMQTGGLYDSQWLLSYEANVKGWLPSLNVPDHVSDDPNFKFLKNNNVEFYDIHRILPVVPTGASLIEGFYPFFSFSDPESK